MLFFTCSEGLWFHAPAVRLIKCDQAKQKVNNKYSREAHKHDEVGTREELFAHIFIRTKKEVAEGQNDQHSHKWPSKWQDQTSLDPVISC